MYNTFATWVTEDMFNVTTIEHYNLAEPIP